MTASKIASLVKYSPVETGLKILNSQSLRWSAPHLANDPFEPDHLSKPDFTADILLEGMIKEAIMMLFGPSQPTGKNNKLIAAISRWRDEERFASQDEAEVVLRQLMTQIAQKQQKNINAYLSDWQQFASSKRICSFSDKPNNLFCWQRYADNHSGIALRFKTGEDTILPQPIKMIYSTTPLLVTSLKQQLAVTYGKGPSPTTKDFMRILLSKNKANNVEREWRCFSTATADLDDDEQLWYTNKTFSPSELTAVYLGIGTDQKDKQSIKELVKTNYTRTKIYQAMPLIGHYQLEFVLLDNTD